tara:strand:- start:12584 stop:13042 length:459 start_codon:yes stop_codon:yes gene_type:complete
MKAFYDVTNQIKTALAAEPFVKTVTFGELSDVDLGKQTIFPLAHLIINNATVGEKIITFNASIVCMDIVDISKDEVTDIFVGNDNEQDILNTQLAVLTRVLNQFQRGDLYVNKFQISEDVSCEPFVDRFENKLAGWTATFNILLQNEMTVCS